MTAQERILVTGHQGYIGSVMAPHLLRAGYEVIGLDTGYFEQCTFVPDIQRVPWICKDIREVDRTDFQGVYGVIHLAALSNDPIGNLDARWTDEINYEASVRIATLAKAAGVERFLFSSSCIMYGMSSVADVSEESPLDPKTEYARSKVQAEEAIRKLAGPSFSPTFLRNGTIYGVSPRMRFDTVLNDLIGAAASTGKITLHSDGKPWRPVVHVEDVARAFIAVLQAPRGLIHGEAFNIGANHLNHQVRELAEIAAETVSGCQLEILAQPGADQRTYKADFKKFARAFPQFEFQWTAKKGARQLYDTFRASTLTEDLYRDKRFTRLKWLRHLLDQQRLDGSLRWSKSPCTVSA
jgi:nucleoside-diphosphate-sugar epimerase